MLKKILPSSTAICIIVANVFQITNSLKPQTLKFHFDHLDWFALDILKILCIKIRRKAMQIFQQRAIRTFN